MTTDVAEVIDLPHRLEVARDLRRQVSELQDVEESEVIFRETSPRRRIYTLYSMEDGSEVPVFRYRLDGYLNQRRPDGSPRFTADRSKAPAIKVSTYKCFLSPESEHRDLLDSLGITVRCNSSHPSQFSMEQVAMKKHKSQWLAYQAYLNRQKEEAWREEERQKTAAIMMLAQNAGGGPRIRNIPVVEPDVADVHDTLTCECGWTTLKGQNSLKAHKRLHCPLKDGG